MKTAEGLPHATLDKPVPAPRPAPRRRGGKHLLSLALLGLVIVLALEACGQRGPLYLPESRPAKSQPAAADAPAAEPEEENDEETAGT